MPHGVFLSPTDQQPNSNILTVASLINVQELQWNQPKLTRLLPEEMADKVIAIPLNNIHHSDHLIWPHSSTGGYTVASAYSWLHNQQDSSSAGNTLPLQSARIWKSNYLTPKLKMFVWRLMMGILPTRDKLHRRKVHLDSTLCPLCTQHQETTHHLLTQCAIAAAIWARQGLQVQEGSPISLLSQFLAKQDTQKFTLAVAILWCIWMARCNIIFKKASLDITKINIQILQLQQELSLLPKPKHHQASNAKGTLYVDASTGLNNSGWAVIAMSPANEFIGAWADFTPPTPPYQAECYSIMKALEILERNGWTNMRIATDCAQALLECSAPIGQVTIQEGKHLTEYIKDCLNTRNVELTYISRDQNVIAHHLARHVMHNSCSLVNLRSQIPTCIKHLRQ